MNIGHLLKLIRVNKGMTQKQMSNLLEISQNYLSLIESSKKTPSSEKITVFAKKLKISDNALLFASSKAPAELKNQDKKDFERLQQNIISLLLFELTGKTGCNA